MITGFVVVIVIILIAVVAMFVVVIVILYKTTVIIIVWAPKNRVCCSQIQEASLGECSKLLQIATFLTFRFSREGLEGYHLLTAVT